MGLPNEIHPFLVTGNDANQYKIPYSLRIRASNTQYLTRTPRVAGDRKTWTWSGWVKRGSFAANQYLIACGGSYTDAGFMGIGFAYSDSTYTDCWNITTGTQVLRRSSNVLRDPSAWYHLMVVMDTTQATAANRVKLYINGTQVTSFNISNDPTQYGSYGMNQITSLNIGKNSVSADSYFDGYLADVHFIDGQALDASYFGQTNSITGVWVPKKYQGLEFTPYTASSSMITQSGLSAFSAANVVADSDLAALPGACFHTDSAGVGSYLQFDLGAGNSQEFRKVRVLSDRPSGQGAVAVWNVQYSDDGSSWTTAYTSLDIVTNNANYGNTDVVPTLAIWGSVGTHRYWRLYKTNGATGGDYHRRVTFYTSKISDTPDYGMNGYYLPFANLSTQTFGNSITYSQNLENAAWTKERATIGTNYFMAPDGTPTADKLYEDTTTSNTHRTYVGSGALSNGTTYCWSVYAKAGERSAFALEAWNNSTAKYVYVDLSTGTVISGSDTNATVTAVGNGWYKCSVTHVGVSASTGSSLALYLMNSATAGAMTYNGDGSSGIYFWGAQCEATNASVPGPYFSTSGSATSTYYQVSVDESKYNKNVNKSYNNFASVGTYITSSPTTSDYTHDSYRDTPTSYNDGSEYYNRANYATLNPLSNLNTTLNSGNLYQYYAGSWSSALATIGVTSGKWYMEAYQVAVVATNYTIIGVAYQPWATSNYLGSTSTSYGFQWNGSTSYKYYNANGGTAVSTPSGTLSVGGILQLAFDADTGNVWYGLNNTWAEGSPSAGTGASHTVSPVPGIGSVWFMGMSQYGGNASAVNFGQRPFSYTPPAGFKALNSYNLPNPSLPLV